MEPSGPESIGKRLWHILRVMYYMLRKGISKHKLMVDLSLILKRGKIAGKALGNLLHHHHHHHHGNAAAYHHHAFSSGFSCRSMDPNLSFYNPRGVEFSCSNTPSYPSFNLNTNKRRNRHHHYDAAALAKALEILNAENSPVASPSPLLGPMCNLGKSPMVVRQLRITDSPFPIREEGEADGRIDKEAEEFIRQFYEQLRLQPRIAATPEYSNRRKRLDGRT